MRRQLKYEAMRRRTLRARRRWIVHVVCGWLCGGCRQCCMRQVQRGAVRCCGQRGVRCVRRRALLGRRERFVPCVAHCTAGSGVTLEGSATRDRTCAACVAGVTFSNADGTSACAPVATCTDTEYEVRAPTASQDRQCARCPAGHSCDGSAARVPCIAGEYAAAGAGMCEQCAAGYWSGDASSTCTACVAGTYSLPGSSSRHACVAWRSCGPGQGRSIEGTPSSDRVCAACTTGASGTWSETDDGSACKLLTTCRQGEWESRAPTVSSDRDCSTHLAACPDGQYTDEAPTTTSDRVCRRITACGATQYEAKAATPSSDRVCEACPAAHRCDGSAAKVVCGAGSAAAAGDGVCKVCVPGHGCRR